VSRGGDTAPGPFRRPMQKEEERMYYRPMPGLFPELWAAIIGRVEVRKGTARKRAEARKTRLADRSVFALAIFFFRKLLLG